MIQSGDLLKKKIDEIIAIARNNTFTLTISIKNRLDPKFLIDVSFMEVLTIEQNFYTDTTDNITLSLRMIPADILLIMKKQSDLYAELKFEFLKGSTISIDLDEEVIILTYNIFIKNMEDITKKYNINSFVDTEFDSTGVQSKTDMTIPIEVQLIDKESYSIKKQSMIGMFTNCTMEKVIKYIAASMGIKRINLVPPSNNTVYTNLYIPPEYSKFNAIFKYLQERYGVYDKGLGYYFTNGTLYIYPEFDLNVKRSKQFTIIRTNPNSYAGIQNYHKETETELTVLSNSKVIQKSMHNVVTENDGNSLMFLLADKMIDKTVIIENDKIYLNDIAIVCNNKDDLALTNESAIPKYIGSTMNIFKVLSEMNNKSIESMIIGWQMARPFKLLPAHNIKLIHDDKEVISEARGVLQSVTYVCKKEKAMGNIVQMQFSSSLLIRVEPFTGKI